MPYTKEQVKNYQKLRCKSKEKTEKIALKLWEQLKGEGLTANQCRAILKTMETYVSEAERQILNSNPIC